MSTPTTAPPAGREPVPATTERGAAPSPPPARSPLAVACGLVRAARPKQWVKNLLVFAAPAAGGVLDEPDLLLKAFAAFVAFCLVSSATYLLNDVGDRQADARHPTKRTRSIASGVVPVGVAVAAAILLLLAGLGVALAVSWQLFAVIAGYKALTVAYTFRLKHIAVLDIAIVASGFIVRAVAGGIAVDIPLSRWFLIVTSFGSLFMVAGKRDGEHLHIGEDRAATRPALADYTREYLRFVWTMSASVTIGGYCLWAFEHPSADSGVPWWGLSIIPFVLAIMRYALLLEQGKGSAPEELVLGDRALLALGAVWVAIFLGSVYIN